MKRIRLSARIGIGSCSASRSCQVYSKSQSSIGTASLSSSSTPSNLASESQSSPQPQPEPDSDSDSYSDPDPASDPEKQSSITARILNAYSLADKSPPRPFTGQHPLASFKLDKSKTTRQHSSSSHFSYSDEKHGKRFTSNHDLFTAPRADDPKRRGSRRGKEKENHSEKERQRELESANRMNRLMETEAHPIIMSGMLEDGMKAGDFVEIRRNGEGQQGILLPAPPSIADRHSNHATHCLLVSTGDLLSFRSHTDIILRFPNFAPSSLVKRASPTQEEVEIPMQSELDQEIIQPHPQLALDEEKLRARVQLCTLIREIKSCSSKLMTEMESHLKDSLSDPESRLDSLTCISTREAANLLLSNSSTSKSASLPALLAAHLLLIANPKRFQVDPSAHRISSTFLIRKKRDIQDVEKVMDWVRDLNSSSGGGNGGGIDKKRGKTILEEFKVKVERVKEWIRDIKAREKDLELRIESTSDASTAKDSSNYVSNPREPRIISPTEAEAGTLKFNRNELAIISSIKEFLGERRTIQNFEGSSELAILLKYLLGSEVTSNPKSSRVYPEKPNSFQTSMETEDFWASCNHPYTYGFRIPTLHALATQLLKDIGIFKPWENVSDLENSLKPNMELGEPSGKAVRGEDGELKVVDGLEERREDFGNQSVYVIDDESAFELDDGISISQVQSFSSADGSSGGGNQSGRYWVHIHVADPSSIISPSSEIADFARKRYSSIYLLEKRWSLLPDEIVNGIDGKGGVGLAEMSSSPSSSSQGQRTLVFSALVDLESDGVDQKLEIKDVKVQAGWVSKVRKLTYKQVGQVLSSATSQSSVAFDSPLPEKESQEIKVLHTISQLLSSKRSEISFGVAVQNLPSFSLALLDPKGLVSVDPPASQFSKSYPHIASLPNCWTGFPSLAVTIPGADSQDSLASAETRSTALAQNLVAELMILAGRIAGSFASSRSLPMPFRGQEIPSQDQVSKLKSLFRTSDGNVAYSDFVKAAVEVKSSYHRISAWEHFSMGIPAPSKTGSIIDNGYIRSTSPLRRYPDLLTHWQLKSQLVANPSGPFMKEQDLLPQLSYFDRVDSKIRAYSRTSQRSWFISYLSRLLALDPQNPILGPHKAMVVLKGVRYSGDLSANVRVRVLGLGSPAECEWGLKEPPPRLGDEFTVRVKDTQRAGGIMSLLVARI